jgi:hypothetical protein
MRLEEGCEFLCRNTAEREFHLSAIFKAGREFQLPTSQRVGSIAPSQYSTLPLREQFFSLRAGQETLNESFDGIVDRLRAD